MKLGKSEITFLDLRQPFVERPMSPFDGASEEQAGQITRFRVTTTDLLDAVFGIVEWPYAETEVRPIEVEAGESKYLRLKASGRLSVMQHGSDQWFAELRAMKYNHESNKANLASIDIERLQYFSSSEFEDLFQKNLGNLGTRASLVADQGKRRNQLAFTCKKQNYEAVAIAFTATRVLPIMFDYGLDS